MSFLLRSRAALETSVLRGALPRLDPARRPHRLAVHELECSSLRPGEAWSICLAPLGLVTTGVILSVVTSPRLQSWAVLLVLAWQLHHFQKQNLGQVALVGASRGLVSLHRGERAAICATGAAGIGGVWANPALLQLDVRPPFHGCVGSLAAPLLVVGVLPVS